MKTTLVASAPLRKDMLDTSDAFVLDTAQTLFVWIGKKATVAEKSKAWDVANVRGSLKAAHANGPSQLAGHPDAR